MAGPFETEFGIKLKDNFTTRYRQIQDEVKRAQESRERLGIRSEQSIRREIRQTSEAYEQMSRSGVVSAGELARAYDRTTEKVSKLRRELGETERTQSRMATAFKAVGAAGGFVVGAGMALRKPITDAASYDAALRKQANLSYSDVHDVAGREKGMRRIDQAIQSSIDTSGASPEEAFAGLETMQRSGVVNREQGYKFLPYVLRSAVATGADAASVANTEASAVNFGLNDKDAPAALSVLTTMAQHGRIDVPEMAHEMPRGLEAGKSAGFYGRRGFAQISAFFEASAIGAKDPQDAAVNANDFLAELTANNLARNGKRIKINGKGIDMRAMISHDLAQGKNALDTVTGVIGKMDATDPAYRRLQKKLAGAHTDAERESLNAQLTKIHGDHVSQLFPNQQARNAYINFDRNRAYYNKQVSEGVDQFDLPEGKRSADLDFNLLEQGPKWKSDRAAHVTAVTGDHALSGASAIWGDLMNDVANLEKQFPVLAEAVSGVTTAFKALLVGGIAGHVMMGAAGGWGIGKIKNWLSKGKVAAEEGVETAEDVAGEAVNPFRAVGRVGKRLIGKVGDIAGDGLLDNPIALTVGGLLYPSSTVDGGDESAELTRLKQQNQRKNRGPRTSGEALQMLQNWPGHDVAPGGNAPVINLPAQPAPAVNVRVVLDSHDIAAAIEVLLNNNARRYGA